MRLKTIHSHWASYLLFVFFLLILTPRHSQAQSTLIINTPGVAPYSYPDQSGILDRWIIEAFERINITVTLKQLPAERSLVDANKGVGDGDAVRVAGLTKIYPNLIQVPEKVYVGEFAAFSKNFSFQPSNWDSLKPYNVAFIRGHKICEANIIGTQSLHKVDDVETLFKLLKTDRVDVTVVESLFGKAMLKEMKFTEAKMISPPLAKLNFYLYLHKKHIALVPKIAASLKDIKQDGTYQKIYSEGLKRIGL